MSEKVAKERGFRKLKPEDIEIKNGKLEATYAKTIINKSAKPLVVGKGGTSLVGVPIGEEPLMGQGTRLPKETDLSGFHQKLIKEQKEKEKFERESAKAITYLRNVKEFEKRPIHEKVMLESEMNLRNIPDFVELTYYKATGNKDKEIEKKGEMIARQKQLAQMPTKERLLHTTPEIFTEGVGVPVLSAGISRLIGGAVTTASRVSATAGRFVDYSTKSVFAGMGVLGGVEVGGQVASGQYGKAMGTASLFPLYLSGALIEGSIIKGGKKGKSLKLKTDKVVEFKHIRTQELINSKGKTIGEISEGKIKFKAIAGKKDISITGRFISTTKNKFTKTLIEIPEQRRGGIKIKRQIIHLRSQKLLSAEKKGLQSYVKGKIKEPVFSREGKIVGRITKEGEVTTQPFARKGISRELQVTRTQKRSGAIDLTKKNIDKQFKKVLDGGYTAYKELGVVSKVGNERSYSTVHGKTNKGVFYKVNEVRIRRPVRNFLDEHLIRVNKNIDKVYKNVANVPKSKVAIAEKISKLKLKAEKLPEKRSLTEKIWREKKKGIITKVVKPKLKDVERAGAVSLTLLLNRMKQVQKQIINNSPLAFTLPKKITVPLIKEKQIKQEIQIPVKKQVPNVVQDLYNKLDQQYLYTNAQIQQTVQTPTAKMTTKIFSDIPPPRIVKPKKPKKGGVIPPFLPVGGVGVNLLDSQYKTITKHIKHNIPKVEKLLRL